MLETLELIRAKVKLLSNLRSALIENYQELLTTPYHENDKIKKEIAKTKLKISELEKEVLSLLIQLRDLQRDLVSVLPPHNKDRTISELFQSMMSEGSNTALVYTKEIAMIFVHGPERVKKMKNIFEENFEE